MDTSIAAAKRAKHLNRVLEALKLDMPPWSTKASPVEAMYRESQVLDAIVERIEALEKAQKAHLRAHKNDK